MYFRVKTTGCTDLFLFVYSCRWIRLPGFTKSVGKKQKKGTKLWMLEAASSSQERGDVRQYYFCAKPEEKKKQNPGKCKSCPQSVFTCSYRSTTCLCSLFVHAARISAAESADACSQSARLSLLQLGSTLLPAWPNASSCISPALCSVLISTGAASCSPLSSCGPRGIACRV